MKPWSQRWVLRLRGIIFGLGLVTLTLMSGEISKTTRGLLQEPQATSSTKLPKQPPVIQQELKQPQQVQQEQPEERQPQQQLRIMTAPPNTTTTVNTTTSNMTTLLRSDMTNITTMNTTTSLKSVELNACYIKANTDNIRNKGKYRKALDLPLFASIVRAPPRIDRQQQGGGKNSSLFWTAHFSLCHVIWHKGVSRNRIPEWSDATWQCDGQEAIVVDRGCENGMGLSIQCPQTDPDYIISNITVYNHTYRVHDHVECEKKHPLKKPVPEAKVAAAVIILKMDLHKALEWVEYHRTLGIDHFFLYVMDADLPGWPDLDYITYVPWNLNDDSGTLLDTFLFQTSAQVDAILRGRALGLDWVAMNDIDEYWVPRGNHTFGGYLEEHFNDNVPAIQGQSVAFGNKPGTKGRQPLILDYVWRSVSTFGEKHRTKCIIRPMHVDYSRIHWISSATNKAYKARPDEIWLHHYKRPENGVFTKGLSDQNTTRDVSVHDKYSAIVGAKVEDILSRIDNKPTIAASLSNKFERKDGCTQDSDCRLEFVHIPKTGGTAVEFAGVAANISWGACIINNFFWLDGKTKVSCPEGGIREEQLGRTGNKQKSPHLPRNVKVNNWHLPPQYFDHPRFATKNPYRGNAALFAIVRNPYDRAISEYYFVKDGSQGKNKNKQSINHPIHNATKMNEWLGHHLAAMMNNETGVEVYNQYPLLVPGPGEEQSLANAAYFQSDGHFIPQYDYIFDGSRQVVHHVLHFEQLGTDFSQLMKAYGLSVVLPNPNDRKGTDLVARKSTNKHLGRYNLTMENMRRIETIYARDFATFGYPTISMAA